MWWEWRFVFAGLLGQPCWSEPYLTATEVLEEEGKALDDGGVFGAVFAGVADEDLGPGPGPLCAQDSSVQGRLRALLIQVRVDVLWKARQKACDLGIWFSQLKTAWLTDAFGNTTMLYFMDDMKVFFKHVYKSQQWCNLMSCQPKVSVQRMCVVFLLNQPKLVLGTHLVASFGTWLWRVWQRQTWWPGEQWWPWLWWGRPTESELSIREKKTDMRNTALVESNSQRWHVMPGHPHQIVTKH